ncbi:MAG: hypothetical protein ACLPV8_26355, partial [Steroidobacteraceae bacterium]
RFVGKDGQATSVVSRVVDRQPQSDQRPAAIHPMESSLTLAMTIMQIRRDKMRTSIGAAALLSALFAASGALAQGMLLDFAADKVIKKFTTSTCDELKAMKGEPPSEKEKMAIDFLHSDQQARKDFIDKIAPVVMNKMFECGMIP